MAKFTELVHQLEVEGKASPKLLEVVCQLDARIEALESPYRDTAEYYTGSRELPSDAL